MPGERQSKPVISTRGHRAVTFGRLPTHPKLASWIWCHPPVDDQSPRVLCRIQDLPKATLSGEKSNTSMPRMQPRKPRLPQVQQLLALLREEVALRLTPSALAVACPSAQKLAASIALLSRIAGMRRSPKTFPSSSAARPAIWSFARKPSRSSTTRSSVLPIHKPGRHLSVR